MIDSTGLTGAGPAAAAPRDRPPPFAAARVGGICVALAVLLLSFNSRYGYFGDELYFRMLARRPAWGYFDQPPLTPMLARLSIDVFGDTLWAIRLPAVLEFAVFVALAALVARELGGRRGAQILVALCVALGPYTLAVGNTLVTNIGDYPFWAAAILFIVRALRRGDGRWWLAAGAVIGLATYNKYLIALLVISVPAGVLIFGPRRALANRWLALGAVVAVVIATPNLIYQVMHGFPQLTMARALSADRGDQFRANTLPQLFLLIGPTFAPIWIAGLVRMARDRTTRGLAAASVIAVVITVVTGGRSDYFFPFQVLLLAAGGVVLQDWTPRAWHRRVLVGAAVGLDAVVALVGALPVIPIGTVAATPVPGINTVVRESIGYPQLAAQIGDVYHSLPAAEQPGAVVITGNYAEAGAVDRYAAEYKLPAVYSGHNELYFWGAPPESTTVTVVLGVDPKVTAAAFDSCHAAATVANGYGIDNPERGKRILVCRGPRGPWSHLWPSFQNSHALEYEYR
jgi:hypothetical protein